MSKFDYIFKEEANNTVLSLTKDIEQVLNKYGLTLITFVDGKDEFEGNIVAFFDIKDEQTPIDKTLEILNSLESPERISNYTSEEIHKALSRAIQAIKTGDILIDGEDYNMFLQGYKDGMKDYKRLEDELAQLKQNSRPMGEWIDTGSGQECNKCHEIQYGYDSFRHFCPNCGAKMTREENSVGLIDCSQEEPLNPEA